ncbi:MAG: putative glycoside hydrolase family 15 protein, partial [Victivallaceae bacterium]|nr:putative glycoside hydrolase family 15 protein [Victivallaceae bacterium]
GDTYEWGWFGSGQPFSYVAAPNGVFVEFPDKPMSASCRQTRKQDDAAIAEAICINVGAQPAPCSTKGVWHVFSPGPEQGNNTYIAWPQFVRKHIVSKIGTKQHSPLPTATHLNSSSEEEQLSTIEAAGKSGFMRYAMPICPSAIESIPTWGKFYDAIGKSGMTTWPWTAGDYTHGSSEKLFGHNDWFIHVPKGSAAHRIAEIKPGNPIEDNGFEIYQYGGHYPVVDLTNPDFQKWYAKILDEACANGLTGIYLDMYGKASGNVNYLKFPASPGIEGMLNIAREFDRHGMPVGVEGENPMFLDTFWFRERLYAPHAGKEFALVGMQPRTDEKGDGFALDFFRMAMYNCYMYTQIDGYIQGFERFPGESRMVERILRLVPTCSMLARKIGIPQVRETPFGTSWISQTGAALFFWHNVEELELALPRGYVLKTMTKPDGSVMELSGKVLKNVSGDSIVYIEKKQD